MAGNLGVTELPAHVVYVLTRADQMSGPQVHLRDLASAIMARGARATVLVGGTGPFTRELARRGIEHRALRHLVAPIAPLRDWRARREIRAHLRALVPDLVSTHSSKAGVLGRLAAHDLGIPAMHTAHGWAFTRRAPAPVRWFYARVERRSARFGRRIVTVSDFDRDAALALGIGDPDTVLTVHNGVVDGAPPQPAAPADDPARLIMVARLEKQKDHVTLLRTLAGLVDRPWTLEVVGDGPLRPALEALVKRLELGDRVRLLGARDDIPGRLASAQVFLLISHFEGFPRSILEAMRAGLPVVATDVAGVPEAVEDGVSGFVIPHRDEATLADRLRQLLDDPGLRARMGEAGRRRYAARFTFEHMLEGTLAVYRQIAAETGGRP